MPTATDRSEGKVPVGLGVLGFAHAHVGMYCREWREKHGDLVTLVAGWDHDEARLKKACEEFGVATETSVEALLARDDIQAVLNKCNRNFESPSGMSTEW